MKKTELARSLGISRQMVYRLMNKGMPADNLETALNWRRHNINLFMSKHGRVDGNTGIKTQQDSKLYDQLQETVASMELDLEVTDAKLLYRNARAVKEKYLALRIAAEYEKLVGSLVSKSETERFLFELAREFRDGLTACARMLSPEIAGKNDIAEIEAILSTEFRRLPKNFADAIASRKTNKD